MQGKIDQMAASDERHLPANMVSYLLERACGRDRRPEHDPEKWKPVFRERSCSNKEMRS
jgi:hypothetical protein